MPASLKQVKPSRSDTLLSTFSTLASVGSETTGTSSTAATATSSASSLNPSDTNFGVLSLSSYAEEDLVGCELTAEDRKWVEAAHAFSRKEQPFREQKAVKSVRKLKVWHPKRSLKWSFLRRLYNGRQDMKEEMKAETSNQETKETVNEQQE